MYSKVMTQQYQQQQILNASAAQQVVMLYDGAIKFMLKAREAIMAADIQERYNNNKRAMEIVSYLLDILDTTRGGDIALKLQVIYGFILKRQLEVDFRNDPRICDEVVEHLKTLRSSWETIARNEKKPVEGSAPVPSSAVA